MEVFLPSIPFNYKHSVHFIYVNGHNATFPNNQRVIHDKICLSKQPTSQRSNRPPQSYLIRNISGHTFNQAIHYGFHIVRLAPPS